jgi:hypothetical protein
MRTLLLAGCVVLFGGSARAEVFPVFNAKCTYRATHIVVAATAPGGAGRFKVAESWLGDLKAGEQLTIPGLAKHAKGDMVLFLARDADPKAAELWKPVGIGKDWQVSVVWFDGEKVLAVRRDWNSPVVSEYLTANSRKEFKGVVEFYLETDRAFAAARDATDFGERAAVYTKIVNGRYDRKDEAFEELGKCGPKALPALRAYLKAPADYQHAYAVRALVAAGGKDVVPELHAMLETELAYWKETGPKLQKLWWLDDHAKNEPWKRFSLLGSLVAVYEVEPTPAYRKTLVALRDALRVMPGINNESGIENMPDRCEKALKKGDR